VGELSFDTEVDVVSVGAGAGGMTAALVAKACGLDTLLIEKSEFFGGSTALSGGGVWIPNAPYFRRIGKNDDPEKLIEYLVNIAGDRVPTPRLARYVHEGPRMMEFLEGHTKWLEDAFIWSPGYSDYFIDKGGNAEGRGLWAAPISYAELGPLEPTMRKTTRSRLEGLPKGLWLTSVDLHNINRIRWRVGWRPYLTFLTLGIRLFKSRVLRANVAANGQALVIRLRLALQDNRVPVWLNAPLKQLITNADGNVIGVEIEKDGAPYRISARRGVIIASGGFDHNEEMRRRYQPALGGVGWSRGAASNEGDGQRAGEAIGAELDFMDDAWWAPSLKMPFGVSGGVAERQYPNQFIVNGNGERYANEAAPYTTFGRTMLNAHETSGIVHIPSYMIFDDRALKQNIICGHFPGRPIPKDWLSSGIMQTADTIEALASKIGVPPENLKATQDRFNQFARQAKDDDFHRGESPYDNYYANPKLANPNLLEVSKPPYYALMVYPGDLGTKGGLSADENGQVLHANGRVIVGLYAVGNASAAVMGTSYAGPGATIGSAMIFGWTSANHLAGDQAVGTLEDLSHLT
jgi:3-oxosteroid 1-dehydrogenase